LHELYNGVLAANQAPIDKDALADEALEGRDEPNSVDPGVAAEGGEVALAGVHPQAPKILLPSADSKELKRLIMRLKRPARVFMEHAMKVDMHSVTAAAKEMAKIEEVWKSLADDIGVEIENLKTFGEAIQKRLDRLRWLCYAGAAAIVVSGVAVTVAGAACTGGASLVLEGGATLAVVAGAGVARAVAPENFARCVSYMSVLTSSIQAASDLLQSAENQRNDYGAARIQIASVVDQLGDLKKVCKDLEAKTQVAANSISLCKTQWKSVYDNCAVDPLADIEAATREFLAQMLWLKVAEVEHMLQEAQKLAHDYEEMATKLRELSESARRAYEHHKNLADKAQDMESLCSLQSRMSPFIVAKP
jgi:methyl-accepting chemotaxis protein